MNELLKRLSLPTPKFFKRLQAIGGAIAGAGAAIIAIAGQYPDSAIIGQLGGIAKELIVAGTIIVAVSQLTVKPETPNKDL